MEQSKRDYDIIVFGITSFTGKWLLHEMLTLLEKKDTPKFTWAVAARSLERIEALFNKVENETGKKLVGKVDMIKADISNPSSIEAMAKKCKIVLNLVGPYQEFGEVVVNACAEAGTHHLDLSAEAFYLCEMEHKYMKAAEKSGAIIIGACGSGSVPSDLGAEYLRQKFDGIVNSIESIIKFPADDDKSFHTMHYATWHSGILAMHHMTDLLKIKKKLYSSGQPPSPTHKLPIWPLQYRDEVNSWCLFNPFPDGDVMERSQRLKFQNKTGQFIQTKTYFQFPSWLTAFFFVFCSTIIGIIAQFKAGANFLLKHPRIFSFGLFSHEGASDEEYKQASFIVSLIAKGWSGYARESGSPNKTKILRIKGYNPCYAGASMIFLLSAITILTERNKMPKKGGVYSPGVAFAETNLIDRLNHNGITFELEE